MTDRSNIRTTSGPSGEQTFISLLGGEGEGEGESKTRSSGVFG